MKTFSLILNKINPYFTGLGLFALGEWFLHQPANWIWQALVVFVFLFLMLVHLLRGKIFKLEFLFWLIILISLVFAAFLILMTLETYWLSQFVVFITALIAFIYLKNIYVFLYKSENYQTNALEHITSYVNLMSLFFFFTAGFYFLIFLSWPLWIPLVGVGIALFILSLARFWSHKVAFKKSLVYSVVFGLIFVELFWVVSYLPISNIVAGFVAAVIYFTLINLATQFIGSQLQKKYVIKQISITGGALLIVLLTAQWF